MELLVVGAGAVGRWFAATVGGETTFVDVDPAAAVAAAERVGGRAVDSVRGERFDAVCLAVPMSAIDTAVRDHADRADRAVVDVTGTMVGPVAAMREHAPDCERASFHPLFAPENAPGNVPVVADAPGPVTDDLRERLSAAGNCVFETTPGEHDAAMEAVQARTHAAALAFALADEPVPARFHTPAYERMRAAAATITDGDPGVYAEIQSTFDGAEDVAAAADRVASADAVTFERLYRTARESVRSGGESTGGGGGQTGREAADAVDAADTSGADTHDPDRTDETDDDGIDDGE